MASTYKRKGSRFYWIKYRDPRTGNVVRESTGILIGTAEAARDVKRMRARKELSEPATGPTREEERWGSWAEAFFEDRYSDRPGSLKNSKQALTELVAYFNDRNIRTPRQVRYAEAKGFMEWQMREEAQGSVGINTARLRFVYFKLLMTEAVRRGYCDFNPCREVEVKSARPKEKQEITADDEVKIEKALPDWPQWMQEQWIILKHQGCRIAETDVPLDRITADTITFRVKGGRLHEATLHQALRPLIDRAKEEGRSSLLTNPLKVTSWSSAWSKLFNSLKLPYSAHCTRVTAITRLVRAGHSVVHICNFIGHTEEVNRIYRKLKPSDSVGLLATLGGAATPSGDNRKREKKGERQAKPARAQE